MREDKLVSIIIPVYKRFYQVKRAVSSIIAQSKDNFEIIIVDDCSADGTLEKIKMEYEDNSTIRIFSNVENSGPGYSRNVGIKNAQGDFILFVDSDDILHHDFMERVNHHLIDGAIDIICPNKAVVDNNFYFKVVALYPSELFVGNEKAKAFGRNDYNKLANYHTKELTVSKIHMAAFGTVYKKSLIDDHNIRFPNEYLGEDLIFKLECVLKARSVLVMEEILYFYVADQDSITHKEFSIDRLHHSYEFMNRIDKILTDNSTDSETIKYCYTNIWENIYGKNLWEQKIKSLDTRGCLQNIIITK